MEVFYIKTEDVPIILEIEIKAGLEKWSRQGHLEEINRNDSINFLIMEKNQVIGYLYARRVGEKEADLLNIGVLEEFRKGGAGSMLWNHLTNYCRSAKIESIWLEVRQSNFNAIEFYKNRGCREMQVRRNFYANPSENALLMKCEVEKPC